MWIPPISREGHEKMRVVVLDKGEASLVEVDWPADRTWQDAFKTAKP